MAQMVQLALTIVLATINSALLHRFGNRGLKNDGDVLLFNGVVSVIWIVVGALVGGGFSMPTVSTWILGVVYGLVVAGFLLSKMLAMSSGNLSMTVMLGCTSLILPTLMGSLLYKETISPAQAVGLVLLLSSMVLCSRKGKTNESVSVTRRWLGFVALFWLFSGLAGLMMKIHQNSPGRDEATELLLIGSVTSAVTLFAMAFILNRSRGDARPSLPKASFGYVAACGLCSCLYNWMNIGLSGALPSVVFFPVFNGSVIFLSALASRFFFRERMTRSQLVGLVLGTFSMMVVGKVLF